MKFLTALALGKMVMIFILSYIGFNIKDLVKKPEESIIVLLSIFIIWVLLEKVIKIDERI